MEEKITGCDFMNISVRICPLAPLGTNCYIIKAENGDAAVIDPASFGPALRRVMEEEGISELKYILLTHGHFDHITGADKFRQSFGGKIAIHRLDAPCLESSNESRAAMFGYPFRAFKEDIILEDGDTLDFGDGEIRVMHTPGHTVGSVCFIMGNNLFSGDTLFRLSVGRTDFPGGSMTEMMSSVKKLKALEGFYKVYPGHEAVSDLDYEKSYNPYMKGI